jgi:chemotaxis methyl-accepting protein methylase
VTIPGVLSGRPDDAPIRVWSAGCATGQESCSLAMLLAEHLGIDAYLDRVKIYATDVDEEALAVARQATYGARETEGLPAELRERYFVVLRDRAAELEPGSRVLALGEALADGMAEVVEEKLDLLAAESEACDRLAPPGKELSNDDR